MKKYLYLLTLILITKNVCSSENALKLQPDNIAAIINALTVKEKAKLAVGMGMFVPGAPPGLLPPLDPEDEKIPPKVPGTSGRTHAVERLGIPSIVLADGPAGIHFLNFTNQDIQYATSIPIGTLLASTWNIDIVKEAGNILGMEAKDYGIDIMLAPASNIHRNPLAGRNFEYYSEDPLLSGNIAAAVINGIQQYGVGTSLKHFVANNSETNRMKLDTFVSERALREIYLKGFEIAIKQSQPWTLMTSYNKVNGTYTSESKRLLTDIVRNEWGFEGAIVSDWFAGQDVVKSVPAGNDLQMPGRPDQTQSIIRAVETGQLPMKDLDNVVNHMLQLIVKTSTFKQRAYSNQPDFKHNAAISRKVASEGMILLKNDKQTLPLKADATIALYGNAGYDLISGGTGSGDVITQHNVSLLDGLNAADFKVVKALSERYQAYIAEEISKFPAPTFMDVFNPHFVTEMQLNTALITDSAAKANTAIITIGRRSGESKDRQLAGDFYLTEAEINNLKTLSELYRSQNKAVVVVINAGGVIEMASWRDYADAILLAWQPGLEGGNAITDILSGAVNPSGKTASTFPITYNDVPSSDSFPGKQMPLRKGEKLDPVMPTYPAEISFDDGIFVGYRYYNTQKIKTAYEFGYGLSYTTFTYSDLSLDSDTFSDQLKVSVKIKNSGKVAGKEVVQLYVSAPDGKLLKPNAELKAFGKTTLLQAGESQVLHFTLAASDLASYDESSSAWLAEKGQYTIKIGASSLDIKLKDNFGLNKLIKL
jgi:beta-glucosidase